jgi:DNA-binding MarR family transcriptional regulator
LAELSDEGRRLIQEILPQHHAWGKQALSALEPSELVAFTAMMRRLLDALPEGDEKA